MNGEHEAYWPAMQIYFIDPVTGGEHSVSFSSDELKRASPDPTAIIMNRIREGKAHLYRKETGNE